MLPTDWLNGYVQHFTKAISMSANSSDSRERFLNALQLLPPRAAPAYDRGWILEADSRKAGFLPGRDVAGIAWSAEHEALHEEPSKNHFIDVFTRRFCLRLLSQALGPGAVFCDVGCSTGYLLEDVFLRFPGTVLAGTDLVAEGLSKCHRRLPEALLFQADVLSLPFGDGSADALACVNVLEHVENDRAALRELSRVLRPGGRGVLVVPAGPHLFDCYDEMLLHYRRYSSRELIGKAEESGFKVAFATSLGWSLYPPFSATKRWNQWRYKRCTRAEKLALVEAQIQGTTDSALGHCLLGIEEFFLCRIPFSIGIRHVLLVENVAAS